MMKMVPQRGPGPPFWGPRGGRDLPFEPLWVPYGSTVPPGSILKVFGRHFGSHFEFQICEIWCRFSICFRDVFGKGFGLVLGLFWKTFWCQNDDQKEKGRFVEIVVLLM